MPNGWRDGPFYNVTSSFKKITDTIENNSFNNFPPPFTFPHTINGHQIFEEAMVFGNK